MDPQFIREEIGRIEAIREEENIHLFPGVDTLLAKQTDFSPKTPWGRLKHIFQQADTEPVELITGVVSFLWGAWLLNPFLSAFQAAPEIFSAISSIAPEWAWGILAFILGVCQLSGLLWDQGELRKNGAFVSFFFWSFVGTAAFMGPSVATTTPVAYPIMALLSAWAYLRRGQVR